MSRDYNRLSQCIQKKETILLSKLIPAKIKYFYAKIVGLKTHPHDRCLIGLFVHMWSLIFAFGYCSLKFWYLLTDIENPDTPSTYYSKISSIIATIIWSLMGMYSQNLIYHLFSSRFLLSCLRIHSRSFLRINIVFLSIILTGVLLSCILYRDITGRNNVNCTINHLPNSFCRVYLILEILYGIPAVFFNLSVFVFILSIMRTHTILIRQQILQLELSENRLFELIRLKQQSRISGDLFSVYRININLNNNNNNYNELFVNQSQSEIDYLLFDNPNTETNDNSCVINRDESLHSELSADTANKLVVLNTDEICLRYRIIFRRTVIISLFFQRWVFMWLMFVVIWTLSYIIKWLNVEITYLSVVMLILPVCIFWLLCSSYAEVNDESYRFFKSIYPSTEKIAFLRYMMSVPIEVSVFHVGLTYTRMASVFVAIGIALLTKLFLNEIPKK